VKEWVREGKSENAIRADGREVEYVGLD